MAEVVDIGVLGIVPLADIRENPAAIRSVEKDTEKYRQLVDSIKDRGVLNPIVVQKKYDPETKQLFYGLVDGLHRYSGAQDAGLVEIPARVVEGTDQQILENQLIANAHRIETKPIEYTKAIQRLMSSDPLMTIGDLAINKLHVSIQFVQDRLGLLKLAPSIQSLVDEGKVNLSNAYALSKLKDHDEQVQFLDRAITMPPVEFAPTVQARVKEINQARRQGRLAEPEVFKPAAHLQKLSDIKLEIENPAIGPFLQKELHPHGAKDFNAGFLMGLQWVLHMDPKSVEAQKNAWEQLQETKKNEKATREREKAEKKATAAREAAAKAEEALAKVLS